MHRMRTLNKTSFSVLRVNPSTGMPVTRNEYYRFWTWAHRKVHKDVYNTQKHDTNKRSMERKKRVVKKYGGACSICGIKDLRVLQVHHINKDGMEHRTRLREEGLSVYTFLDQQPPQRGIVLLCANCHAVEHTTTIYAPTI